MWLGEAKSHTTTRPSWTPRWPACLLGWSRSSRPTGSNSITSGPNALARARFGATDRRRRAERGPEVRQPADAHLESGHDRGDRRARRRRLLPTRAQVQPLGRHAQQAPRAMLRGIFEHARSDQWGVRGVCSLAGFPSAIATRSRGLRCLPERGRRLRDHARAHVAAGPRHRPDRRLLRPTGWPRSWACTGRTSTGARSSAASWFAGSSMRPPASPPPQKAAEEGPAGAAARLRRRPAQRPLARAPNSADR